MFSKVSLVITSLLLLSACVPETVDNSITENPEGIEPKKSIEARKVLMPLFGAIETVDINKAVDTTNWKVCKNETLGINLRYPPEWGECSTQDNKFAIETGKELNGKYLNISFGQKYTSAGLYDIDMAWEFMQTHKKGVEYAGITGGYVLDTDGYAGAINDMVLLLEEEVYTADFDLSDEKFDEHSSHDQIDIDDWNVRIWEIATTIEKIEAEEVILPTDPEIVDEPINLEVIKTDIDTSDWLVYTNEEHGFELKYPVGWTTKRYGSNIWFEGANGSLYAKFSKDDDFEADLFLDRKYDEKKIVNGEVVRKFVIDDRRDHGCQDVCPKTIAYKFRKGQMGYSLYSSYDEDIVEAIISTFKFLEDADIDKSNWKICENETLELSLRYPSDWGECFAQDNEFAIETSDEFSGKYLNVFFEISNIDEFKTAKDILNFVESNREWDDYVKTKDGYALKIRGYAGTIDDIVLYTGVKIYFVGFSVDEEKFSMYSAFHTSSGKWSREQEEYTWEIATTIESI